MTKLLVAYGSKYGATAAIARRIAEVCRQAGLETEDLPAQQVKSLTEYQAVIVGSGVYIGQWLKPAANFLKQYEAQLAQRPVWLFSSGPTGEGPVEDLLQGWTFPKSLQPVMERIHPREVVAFSGALVPEKMNFFERWIIKRVNAPLGDFRDWPAIETWANTIAETLLQETTA